MALYGWNGGSTFSEVAYLNGIGGCTLGYMIYVSNYAKVRILTKLECVCCIREQVAHSFMSLNDRHLNFDIYRYPYHGVPLNYMMDEVLVYQRLFADDALVFIKSLVGALPLLLILSAGEIAPLA